MILLNYMTIISFALTYVVAQELYSDKYDADTDVMSVLENEELRNQYVGCIMETSPCVTEDAKFYKEIFAEIIETNCKKCTQKQKDDNEIIKDWFTKNKPDEWQALNTKAMEEIKKKNANQ
ncbi:putative odorant-binding protein A10 [Monomorium pharaonis]|uniref:putative odorant-binding protein A10 n=1 Tax=Monomorium pharaonis TaxID=307658 RepID=UPI00063F5BA8|nr:putative odorant-binding protein A10 [Monomorium pharaonis]